MFLAGRTFHATDQVRFAELTGDRNPMHMDAVAARRTQAGAPVVHGMHVVLWALDELIRKEALRGGLSTLKVQFQKFVFVGAPATLRIVRESDRGLIVAVDCAGVPALTMTINAEHRGHDESEVLSSNGVAVDQCAIVGLEEVEGRHGLLPELESAAFGDDFPALTATVGVAAVRSLAQLSTLVGMVCPGLHSIFAGFAIRLHASDPNPRVSFRVETADDRFRMTEMAVAGGGLSGTITAFIRHPPIEQAVMSQLTGLVSGDEFSGTTALVVGGSRGLGSVTSRLLALGGARVIVTWLNGEAEAQSLADEIGKYVGEPRCAVVRYDALNSPEPQLAALPWEPNQLYYFATSRIFRQKSALYQPEDFADFTRVYVDAFQAVCAALQARVGGLTAFYPSSVAVEEHPRDMVEYSMAKAAGEMLCADLNRFQEGMRVIVKRLPRMLTDQTATVATVASRNPIEVMLPIVREMQAGGHSSEPLPSAPSE
jgi:NAD(P)-dependent dehydrogenase (short-subunit alcohol dehydrogenase family)